MFFVKRTFNYRYMFYYMNRNIVLTSLCTLYGLCSQCSLVCWRWIICSSKLQGRYNSFYNQLSATDKHVLESVHVKLSSLLEGGICVCCSIFMFFENSDVKSLSFCCKNMSTHSFVSFRNISILSLICLSSSCFFLSLFMCLYIPGFSKAQFYGLILEAFASLVVNVIDI